jgi:hypothetical protein
LAAEPAEVAADEFFDPPAIATPRIIAWPSVVLGRWRQGLTQFVIVSKQNLKSWTSRQAAGKPW